MKNVKALQTLVHQVPSGHSIRTYMVDPGQCPAGSRTMETDSVESEMDRVTGSSIGKDF